MIEFTEDDALWLVQRAADEGIGKADLDVVQRAQRLQRAVESQVQAAGTKASRPPFPGRPKVFVVREPYNDKNPLLVTSNLVLAMTVARAFNAGALGRTNEALLLEYQEDVVGTGEERPYT